MGYADFSQQFVQNALNPLPAPAYQLPYQTWSPAIQQAYSQTSTIQPAQQAQLIPSNDGDGSLSPPINNNLPPANNVPNPLDAYNNQMQSSINQQYDSYFRQLDNMLAADLPSQRRVQEEIVNTAYSQGVSDLQTQESQSLADLELVRSQTEQSQQKDLRTLSEDVRRSMQAGNVYLGARGASDSSAANMYSYALTKEANKNRSNLLSNYTNIQKELNLHELKIRSTIQNEMKRLLSEKTQNLLKISDWYTQATQNLRLAIANGQLSKGKDLQTLSSNLLTIGISQIQNIQNDYNSKVNTLNSWAINRSANLSDLKTNLQGVSAYYPQMSQYQGFNPSISFSRTGTQPAYFPGNVSQTEKKYNPLTGRYE